MGGGTAPHRRAPAPGPRPVVLEVLGRIVAVDAGGHTAAAQVEALWSRCRPADTAGDRAESGHREHDAALTITLPRSDRPLTPEVGLGLTDRVVEAAVAGAAGRGVGAAEGRLTLLRAAAVASPGGAVLGLLAGPGAGRSTAAAELCRRGFGYVTDELLAVTTSGEVLAFPQPLSFEHDDDDEPTSLAGPDALGLRACPAVLRLAGLVVLGRDPAHAGAPTLTRLADREARAYLLAALLGFPGPGESAAGDLDPSAGLGTVWRLAYAEIFDAAPLLADLLADLLVERTRPVDAEPRYVAAGLGPAPADDSSVTVRGQQVELDDLRRAVWRAATGGATLEDLTVAVNTELATRHRISAQLVGAALRDLLGLGLVMTTT